MDLAARLGRPPTDGEAAAYRATRAARKSNGEPRAKRRRSAQPGREVPAALHGVGNDGGWMRLGAAAPSMPPRPAASDSEPPAASEPDRERKRQKSEPS